MQETNLKQATKWMDGQTDRQTDTPNSRQCISHNMKVPSRSLFVVAEYFFYSTNM